MNRLFDQLQFRLERMLVRGAHYRVLIVAMLIGLLSIAGGVLVRVLGSGFASLPEAVWWAFLRLSDPGYLGDDVGTFNRIVSTLLTVLGYVVFLGSLVAIMTQWLNARLLRLERGLTPVARRNHIVILGWTNRTRAIVRELLVSEGRVRRFLHRRGARSLHIVVLAGEVTASLVQDLRDFVGDRWDERRVTLRSGSPLRPEHLARVDAANAAAIIIPGTRLGADSERADSHTIKALLSLGRMAANGERPYVVTEIFETHDVDLARQAYGADLEVIASDGFVSRLLAQNLRHPGLAEVYNELLSYEEGNEIYARDAAELDGCTIGELHARFPRAVLLGIARPDGGRFEPLLNAPAHERVAAADRLVLIAESYAHTDPEPATTIAAPSPAPRPASPPPPAPPQRILVLGWNHKVPELVQELGTYARERFDVHVASTISTARRTRALQRAAALTERVAITHHEADFTLRAELAALRPDEYDGIAFMGSDRFEAQEESDARTLMGFLVLEQLLPRDETRPAVLVELLDPQNVELLEGADVEVMISPMIVSHMLAQVALRRELRGVFDELFSAGGAEIFFRAAADYLDAGADVGFADVQRAAAARGETALGIRRLDGAPGAPRVRLNPDRAARWRVDDALQLVTLVASD